MNTGGGGAIQFLIGSLKVLSNLLKGSTKSGSLKLDHISRIIEVISSNEHISNENLTYRLELANLLNAILKIENGVFNSDHPVSYSMFYILVHLKSTEGNAAMVGYNDLLERVRLLSLIF